MAGTETRFRQASEKASSLNKRSERDVARVSGPSGKRVSVPAITSVVARRP